MDEDAFRRQRGEAAGAGVSCLPGGHLICSLILEPSLKSLFAGAHRVFAALRNLEQQNDKLLKQ